MKSQTNSTPKKNLSPVVIKLTKIILLVIILNQPPNMMVLLTPTNKTSDMNDTQRQQQKMIPITTSSGPRRREGGGGGGREGRGNNRKRSVNSIASSSYYVLYYYCLLLLLLESLSSSFIFKGVDAYIVLSRESSFYNPTSILDAASRKSISVGIGFRPDHGEITSASQADTQCMVSIGDFQGFDRTEYDTPQMCIDVVTFPPQGQIPVGVVAGISGRQATLYEMSFIESYTGQPLLKPMNLPIETYPVGLATDVEGGVYVGLHDTGGLLVEPTDFENELGHILNYFDHIKQPNLLGSDIKSPTAMKVNMTSSKVMWQTTLETYDGQSTIGGIAMVPSRNILVVAGSSNGHGTAVGANVDSGSTGEWDGYVSLVDSNTGLIDDTAAALTHITADHSLRIQSQIGQDDFIHSVCVIEEKIFLVGSTTGIMDENTFEDGPGGAFIMKLDLDTLNVLWKVQIRGDGVTATRCMGRGGTLYVAGHVPPGVVLTEDDDWIDRPPSSTQDIMTAAIDTDDGNVKWVRQIDSRRDDRVCSVLISAIGDMFLTGNAYDISAGINKAYVMTIELDGGIHDWLGLPQDADPIEGYAQNNNLVTDENDETNEGNGGDDDDDDKDKTIIIVIAVVVPVVLLLLVAICAMVGCNNGTSNNTSNNKRSSSGNVTEEVERVGSNELKSNNDDDEDGNGHMT